MSNPCSWVNRDLQTTVFAINLPQTDSFKRIMEDNFVSSDEVRGQEAKVLDILEKLDRSLPPEWHSAVAELMSEVTVLSAIQARRVIQEVRSPFC
jgi:hypothetical protein